MREPGRLLLRLAQVLGLSRIRETVVLPAVADMQHERAEAESPRRRAWALARGYWSIVSASAFYLALSPARHFREDWSSMEAPGARLLRQSWLAIVTVAALCLAAIAAGVPHEQWQLGPGVVALLLPSFAVAIAPFAMAIGVGWALARDRSGSRAALAVGFLGAGLSFGVFDLAVTRANQAYRVASYEAHTGRSTGLRKGSREMTLSELGAATSLDEVEACPMPAPMSSCSSRATPALLRVEWHNRLSIPAFVLSLMMLSISLSRSGRRVVVVLGLWPTYVAANWMLRVGYVSGSRGEIPVVLAAWGAHIVPLALAFVVNAFARRRELNPALPQGTMPVA